MIEFVKDSEGPCGRIQAIWKCHESKYFISLCASPLNKRRKKETPQDKGRHVCPSLQTPPMLGTATISLKSRFLTRTQMEFKLSFLRGFLTKPKRSIFISLVSSFNTFFFFCGDILNNSNMKRSPLLVIRSRGSDRSPFSPGPFILVTYCT